MTEGSPPVATRSGPLAIYAPAKVNWFLEVLGKRSDGYHEIVTFMVAVDLCDYLIAFEGPSKEISLEVKYPESAGGVRSLTLSNKSENLVWRAAACLREATGCRYGAHLVLEKRIPLGAGLGGGSSDAAATLLLLNTFWGLGLSGAELATLAARIGSDVAFFLHGAAAWCRGRGEIVSPWPMARTYWLGLIVPLWPVSTASVYAQVRVPSVPRSEEDFSRALVQDEVPRIRAHLFNRLEEAAYIVCPDLVRLRELLEQAGLSHVRLSGSGGTFFFLCSDYEEAEGLCAKLRTLVPGQEAIPFQVYVVPTLDDSRYRERHMPHPYEGQRD
ncbi:MAG: 4-(cytidine 5'-diphospho)-2-C-methyl-D-erythritol kinase [Gemmatales bacterium]|nr:4-(cytidine 5'-diphospho)-2-C-methyl-D-erythritol kinase [Gemmatales bacterium]MDW7993457.1 4-(cytidine 5'-diphospho)-2-C-methyl-D-erythritol kinase [Gemmatales bacterium]